MLLCRRIWEDVVGTFLYPSLVLHGVHLLHIDNVPLLFGLSRSSPSTEVDPDPSNLQAEVSTSFTDCRLTCLSNTKYKIYEETGRSEYEYQDIFSHLVVSH